MSENQQKKTGGKTFKLLLVILLVLAVPIVMDQVDVDRENVKLVGRIAVGITGLLFVIGLFKKMLKVMAFVVLGLIALVFLVAEGHIKAPRLSERVASKQPK
jgi:uncharacterized membrane protein